MRGALIRAVLFAGACGLLPIRTAAAQMGELHWKELAVDARLDAEGALHVKERHHIVFTGSWNGGERVFDLPFGQMVELRGVTRVDPATGAERAVVRGDLARLDHFEETFGADALTVRWRSRMPDDPLFDRTPIVYVLDYVLYGALEQHGDTFALDHDFAFERPSAIDALTVRLTIDPSWRVHGTLPSEWRAQALGPEEAFVVRAVLSGNATLNQRRDALQLIVIAVPALLFLVFLWQERRRGRFAPLEAVPITDPQFLADHLFRYPPELVAVLWNRSAPRADAVAALLARLELDGKIRTQVDGDQLQMQLLVPRTELIGYEREFLEGFFFAGDTTSTAAVRAHYKKSGFHPARPLRAPLSEQLRALAGPSGPWWRPLWLPLLMLAVGLFCLLTPPGDGVPRVLIALVAGVWVAAAGSLLAWWWRRRLDFGLRHTPMFLAVAIVPLAIASIGLQTATRGWAFGALLGVVLVALAYFKLILNYARSNEPAAGLALRRKLTACRQQLQEELRHPHGFTESIVPYIFAFGLGKAADAWFVQAQRRGAYPIVRSGSSGSTANSGEESSGGYGGGGGAFGGAGASGAWVSAIGAMSAGVSSPSSSSSSGGGGGGSRSGGGSAGGW